ncbi:MAG: ATP-binding protein [bacterium]|nr:ATP-binding protein [bacterium]
MLSEFARLELQAVLAVYRKQGAPDESSPAGAGGAPEESKNDPAAADPEEVARGQAVREIEAALSEHYNRAAEYVKELDPRFVQLCVACGLSAPERDILLLALAPAWHPEFESIFAALAEREYRGLTPDIIARVFEGRPGSDAEREVAARYAQALYPALGPDAPLSKFRLLRLLDPGEALYSTRIVPDSRVLLFLQGSDDMAAGLTRCLRPALVSDASLALEDLPLPEDAVAELKGVRELLVQSEAALAGDESAFSRRPLIQLHGPEGNGKGGAAVALVQAIERPLLRLDAGEVLSCLEGAAGGSGSVGAGGTKAAEDRAVFLREITRETLMYGAALLVSDWHLLADHPAGRELLAREFEYLAGPLILISQTRADLNLPDGAAYLSVELPLPDAALRRKLWEQEAAGYGDELALDESVSFDFLATGFRFTHKQIRGAFRRAHTHSLTFAGGRISQADLLAGAYAESNRGLNELAMQVRSRPRWNDLVLRPEPLRQLTELCNQAKYSAQVYQSWGFSPGTGGQGLHALFVGAPGTGKTMAASVVATELGLEIYRIDLSSIVSKYIGETEKNLSRIFHEAETSNAVLFFDEADALFGKRGEVKDAQDRYANMEVSYLLQKMEDFPGITILATNFRANLDKAFVRRLHYIIDFPFPDANQRMGIWELNFPKQAPLSRDVDLAFLAARLDVPGALIKNIARNAAFLAASEQSSISLRHIRRAAAREYQKDNRPVPDFSAELH